MMAGSASTLPKQYLRNIKGAILNDKDIFKTKFLQAAEDWVCDPYSIDIRYLVRKDSNQSRLWEALIQLNPLPAHQDMSFHVETSLLSAGHSQLSDQPKQKLLQALGHATQGQVSVYGSSFSLSNEHPYEFDSEMAHRDRWISDLHLQVIGRRAPAPTPLDAASIGNALRRSTPPFDGLADISAWLGLNDPQSNNLPSVKIRVGPPVDLISNECRLGNDHLHLTLHAHPRFDISRIGLAVRAVPGNALESRRQVASEIKWKRIRNGRREGIVRISLERADSALAMLMIGDYSVRREWFLDPSKARNNRLVAMQYFDKDLRMVKQAVLEASDSKDSKRFELGIAALLFLLGFTPAVPLETDSPDLIVTTPGGKLVIVECTTRIADFSSKLGKLVDRRGALSKALQASDHHTRIDAILICALPRKQIAARAVELETHQAVLITKDELEELFDLVRSPNDPDKMLDEAVAQLATKSKARIEGRPEIN